MRNTYALAALTALTATFAVGTQACGPCGSFWGGAEYTSARSASDGANAGAPTPSAQGVLAEADIIQTDPDGRLYALSRTGQLAVISIKDTEDLHVLGATALPGTPFEMYRRGHALITMNNNAVDSGGREREPLAVTAPALPADDAASAQIIVVDASNAAAPVRTQKLRVAGQIADSRMIGDVLYVLSYDNGSCFGCEGEVAKTTLTSFQVSAHARLEQVDQVSFSTAAYANTKNAWGGAWKRSMVVGNQRLYIGGTDYAKLPERAPNERAHDGVIDVLDISSGDGHVKVGAHLETRGSIMNRWQMDETDGVLRVVSQYGVGHNEAGVGAPAVQTFRITSAEDIQPLGQTELRLPRQESLRTVRFDGKRAYAITFFRTDPLFVIDLADPAKPKQRGMLEMPGWVFHLEPHGDRLLGLGIDSRSSAPLNVSLFDVSDLDKPKLAARASFGEATSLRSDATLLDYSLPEEQDRIQKAFRMLEDGRIVVPFALHDRRTSSGCGAGGIQVLTLEGDALATQFTLPMEGNPRRALLADKRLLGVSDSQVRAFNHDGMPISSVEIAKCGGSGNTGGYGYGGDHYHGRDDLMCY
jgi:hypothetical protein